MLTTHNLDVERLGKTLNLGSINHPSAVRRAPIMFSRLLLQFQQAIRPVDASAPTSPAAALMESADVSAGVDAHHAQELRVAASAFLSVVR